MRKKELQPIDEKQKDKLMDEATKSYEYITNLAFKIYRTEIKRIKNLPTKEKINKKPTKK